MAIFDENAVCWLDQLGDLWEREGIDSGRIFEIVDGLGMNLVATRKEMSPGVPPHETYDILKVAVYDPQRGAVRIDAASDWTDDALKEIIRRLFLWDSSRFHICEICEGPAVRGWSYCQAHHPASNKKRGENFPLYHLRMRVEQGYANEEELQVWRSRGGS